MKTHKWTDVRNRSKLSEGTKARIDRELAEEVLEYNLRELREACGLTQVEMANRLESVQPAVARVEAGTDAKLSTLRKYVTALGGELKVLAVVKGRTVELSV